MMLTSRAMVLGAVQGPTELLPVSSSAHLTLIPWLAGWDSEGRDPELQKSFEVALHAGAAAALLVGQRRVIAEELRTFDRARPAVLALSFLPPAVCGLALERPIERRLGGPLPTAVGLLAGAAAMVAADRRPQRRDRGAATALDGLALGTGAGGRARSRRLAERRDADRRALAGVHPPALQHALPHRGAAGDRRRGGAQGRPAAAARAAPGRSGAAFAAGTAASFASTLASQALIRLVERDSALWPYAAYRAGLAGRCSPTSGAGAGLAGRLSLRNLTVCVCRRRQRRLRQRRAGPGERDRRRGASRERGRLRPRRGEPGRRGRRGGRAGRGPGGLARARAARCSPAGTTRTSSGSTTRTGIALSTDGVGTKLLVAEQLGRWDTVGHRLRGDERQRRDLRGGGAAGDGRLPRGRPRRRRGRRGDRRGPRAGRGAGRDRDRRRRARAARRADQRPRPGRRLLRRRRPRLAGDRSRDRAR